jgi:metal-sulfur cluster biosynthetic enzyme
MELLGENWAEAPCGERVLQPLTTVELDRLRQVTEDVLCCIVTRDLGAIMADVDLEYEIRVEGARIHVELGLATCAWSLGEQVAIDVEQAICAALVVDDVEVQFVWAARRGKVRMLPIATRAPLV